MKFLVTLVVIGCLVAGFVIYRRQQRREQDDRRERDRMVAKANAREQAMYEREKIERARSDRQERVVRRIPPPRLEGERNVDSRGSSDDLLNPANPLSPISPLNPVTDPMGLYDHEIETHDEHGHEHGSSDAADTSGSDGSTTDSSGSGSDGYSSDAGSDSGSSDAGGSDF